MIFFVVFVPFVAIFEKNIKNFLIFLRIFIDDIRI